MKTYYLLLISLCLFACSKQSAPDLSDTISRGREEQERLDACSTVNLNKDVLNYSNTILLFKCTGWNKDFPSLFKSLNLISADSWDQVFTPINETFINDQARRDRFFRNIRELDKKNGLDDLSYVILALNETNFFDSVRDMFKCVEDNTLDFCKSRTNIPRRTSLKKIIEIIKINPDTVLELSKFLRELNLAIGSNQENLRKEVNRFKSIDSFAIGRLRLVDVFAQKMKNGLSEEDRVFITKLLQVTNKKTNNPWIYDWLHDSEFNRIKFRDLLEYPALINPAFIHDVRGVRSLYDLGLNCTLESNINNQVLDFDLKVGVKDYLSVIKNKSYKDFYSFSSMHVTGLKASKEVCKQLEVNAYNVSLINAAVKVAEFFSEKKNYDLVRFILNNSTSEGDTTKNFGENIYLGDFLAGNIFSGFNDLNIVIANKSRDFFPVLYDIALAMPPESLLNISNFIFEISKSENDLRLKGISDFWMFFTPEEKKFLFKFIDRHFDNDINYPLLFDFYSKTFADISETQTVFADFWAQDEVRLEKSYLALQDIFYNLSGKENLLDLKKFFSRDQILKVLEVISNGQQLVANAKEELRYRDSSIYIQQSKLEKYKFRVNYVLDTLNDYDSKKIISCMQKFAQVENGFYEIVKNFPVACSNVKDENISFKIFGWLNFIQADYARYHPRKTIEDSIFDEKGILSPYMLNTNIGLVKIADSILGPAQNTNSSKNGISYLLDSTNYYLNIKNGIDELNKQIGLLVAYLDVKPIENTIYRNSLIKSFTKEDNFSYSKNVFRNFSDLIYDFGVWISSGKYQKVINRSLGSYDPKYSCENSLNTFLEKTVCPTKNDVKLIGNRLLFALQNTWEPEMGSPIKHILNGVISNGGIVIPLNRPPQMKYRLSLTDNIRYLYDTSDRSLSINNQLMNFVNKDNINKKLNLTTLERVETVIREVRFGNNYLGASYLNHVVEGDDYNSEVIERKKLMSTCINIPGARCGRRMSNDDLRMGRNALEAYDSLLDVNNGKEFKYGNFLKAFQQTLIASSSKEAQELTFLPLKDEVLKKHNGIILSDITLLGGFSNAARFIRDRFGRTRSDFDKFLNREDFKRVDRMLLYGFDLKKATPAAERIINKLLLRPSSDKQNLFENSVDWYADLSYEDSLLVEDTFARLMVVGSYLGTPDVVFNMQISPKGFERYKENNLFLMFLAFEKILDNWQNLRTYFPGDAKLIGAIRPINTFLYFLTENLNSTKDPNQNKAYMALNDIFLVLQTTIFDDVQDGRIAGKTDFKIRGVDLISEGLKDTSLVSKTYEAIRSFYRFTDNFYLNQGQFFINVGTNLKRLVDNAKFDLTPIRDYLNFTSKNSIKVVGDSSDNFNYHYDELATLIKYLNQKDENGNSNLNIVNQKIFQQNYKEIISTLEDILPCLKIKEVKTPFAIN